MSAALSILFSGLVVSRLLCYVYLVFLPRQRLPVGVYTITSFADRQMSDQRLQELADRLALVEHSLAELCGLVALSLPPRHKDKAKLEAELTVIFERHYREEQAQGESSNGPNSATSG